jgi:FAD synthase
MDRQESQDPGKITEINSFGVTMIKGKRSPGLGLATYLGFPTINLYIESEDTGVFIVEHEEYGEGVAFVMPSLTEIHFFNPVENPPDEIECKILNQIDPPENGILDYFCKGLEYAKNTSSVA